MRPLLSICIPTYNRAELLNTCLATILPQTVNFPLEVEVCVSNNASTDETQGVLKKYGERFSFHCHQNATNVGLIGNITLVAGSLAKGEYVWLLGDDDLLAFDAIPKVVNMLKQVKEQDLDLVALNVGYYASERRPQARDVEGGVIDSPKTKLRRFDTEGIVPFEQLLEGPCVDFTAMYASIVRQRLWATEFPSPFEGQPFASVRSTYPHAWLIARHLPGKLAGVLRNPVVCNYEMPSEQFSWSKFHALTVVLHATALLKMFETHGVPFAVLQPYYLYQLNNRGSDLGRLCWNAESEGGWKEALRFAWMLRHYPVKVLKLFIIGCANSQAPAMLRVPVQRILKSRLKRSVELRSERQSRSS